jgi:hypothetical protein
MIVTTAAMVSAAITAAFLILAAVIPRGCGRVPCMAGSLSAAARDRFKAVKSNASTQKRGQWPHP